MGVSCEAFDRKLGGHSPHYGTCKQRRGKCWQDPRSGHLTVSFRGLKQRLILPCKNQSLKAFCGPVPDQFLAMRNAILSSAFSQLDSMGHSEMQLLNLDVPSQTTDNYGFCMESKLFHNDSKLKVGGFTIPCQHPISYQPGCFASISRTDNVSPQSTLFHKKISFQPSELDGRKGDILTHKGPRTAPSDHAALNNGKSNKRMKATPLEHGLPSLVQEESAAIQYSRLHVPERRSQRLSDKITALQKLVSPYGKTDTASVLQEACLYIKLLQDHIESLLRMQNSSYKNLKPQGNGWKQAEDLRSRGLCLVPVTFTQKIAMNSEHC